MGPEAQGKGSIMRKVTRITAALIVCMALGVTTAAAAPRGNGEGHAYAWGLYKDRGQVEVVEPAPVEPVTIAAQPTAPVGYEDVFIYDAPLDYNGYGYYDKLYLAVKSASVGYARHFDAGSYKGYTYDGTEVFRAYQITFDAVDGDSAAPAAWSDPLHRTTYAFSGFTTVAFNGQRHAIESPEAAVALRTPGVRWTATYREVWSPLGYLNPTGFNGWVVMEYTPAP